jgi:hypothetical protein
VARGPVVTTSQIEPKNQQLASAMARLLESQGTPEMKGVTQVAAALAREAASGRANVSTLRTLMNSADGFLRKVGQSAMMLHSALRGEVKEAHALFSCMLGKRGNQEEVELLLRDFGASPEKKGTLRRLMDQWRKSREVGSSASFRTLYNQARAQGGSSPSRTFEVKAAGHWRPTPVISQLNPRGATPENYKNGVYNCAGAAVAMLARGLGFGDELTDAQLITRLSAGVTTRQGTTLDGVGVMLNQMGARLAGKVMVGGYSDAMVRDHLASNNKLIAQVGIHNVDTGRVSPHYVVVDRMDGAGNYVVKDPLMGRELAVKPEQLRRAVGAAPGAGGAIIPIAGSAVPLQTPAHVSAMVGDGFGAAPVPPLAAFETTSQVVAGRDATYHQLAPATRGQSNLAAHFSTGLARGSVSRVASEGQSAQEIAHAVKDLLNQSDDTLREQGRMLFQHLEASEGATDQQARDEVARSVGRQPGIGQKVELDLF